MTADEYKCINIDSEVIPMIYSMFAEQLLLLFA